MEKNLVKSKIVHLLEMTTEQAETILSHEQYIPQIELDILMSNVRELYEKLYVLNKINKTLLAETDTEEYIPQTKAVEEKIETKKTETIIATEKTTEVIVEPKIEKEEIKEEYKAPIIEKTKTIEIKEEVKSEIKSTKKTKTPTPLDLFGDSVAILKDKFKTESTINEKILQETDDTRIISKIQKQSLKDLKSAIGINEKFLFINELFEGNMQDYNDAITYINESCSELKDALEYVESLSEKYNWNKSKSSYNILKTLVERRFN